MRITQSGEPITWKLPEEDRTHNVEKGVCSAYELQ